MTTFFINCNLRSPISQIARITLWGSQNIKNEIDLFALNSQRWSYASNQREIPKADEKVKATPAELVLFSEMGHYEWKQKLKVETLLKFVLPDVLNAYLISGYQVVSTLKDNEDLTFVLFKNTVVVSQPTQQYPQAPYVQHY